jgi:hypothetical protein
MACRCNHGLQRLPKERLANNSKDHPDASCLPVNPLQLHTLPQARKIIQAPGLVLILHEANDGRRQNLHRWPAASH